MIIDFLHVNENVPLWIVNAESIEINSFYLNKDTKWFTKLDKFDYKDRIISLSLIDKDNKDNKEVCKVTFEMLGSLDYAYSKDLCYYITTDRKKALEFLKEKAKAKLDQKFKELSLINNQIEDLMNIIEGN